MTVKALALIVLSALIPATIVAEAGRTVSVPIDYNNPQSSRIPLYFELGAPFDPAKPTVIVIADGQQYYVRKDAVVDLQKNIFGDGFNVVGIVGRGSTPEFVNAALNQDGQPDWLKAWQIFNSDQWVEDIESVRKALLPENAKICLYGRSGGAYLVHQYLSKYGAHASRAFTQSAVNPYLVRNLGINLDKFWDELKTQDPNLQETLKRVLKKLPDERVKILMTFQRQHFFVPADQLPQARAELIRALDTGNTAPYQEARKNYEVDSVMEMLASHDAIPLLVRVFEFFYPSGMFQKLENSEAVYPQIENWYSFTTPLIGLVNAGKITVRDFDLKKLHRVETEVFILSGRRDEVVDYRTSIALAYSYPQHLLFIADDSHVFSKLSDAGLSSRIVQSFLMHGIGSAELKATLLSAEAYRWKE
jgi:pimeloyl-ACP methyl ester carboxylesterase